MLAAISPATMNFPFSYPYDDDMNSHAVFDPSSAVATSMVMAIAAEDVLSAYPTSIPFPLQSQQQQQRQQQQRHLSSDHSQPLCTPSPPAPTCPDRYRSESSRWRALVERDPEATDAFVYAVVTTKIYCRPNCSARLARRANVRFFDLAGQAERGGFRACKRCKPNRVKFTYGGDVLSSSSSSSLAPSSAPSPQSETPSSAASGAENAPRRNILPVSAGSAPTSPAQHSDADGIMNGNGNGNGIGDGSVAVDADADADAEDIHAKIQRAAHLIRQAAAEKGQPLSLSQLSGQVGLSKWHLQRVFKKLQGMTPREMAEEIIRAKEAQGQSTSTSTSTSTATATVTVTTTDMMPPVHPSATQPIHSHSSAFVSGSSSTRGTDDLAFPHARPPLPFLPLLDEGMDWFDEPLDGGAVFDYFSHQPHLQLHQEGEEELLPAPFADCAHTLRLPMGMDTDMNLDMGMNINMHMGMSSNMNMDMDLDIQSTGVEGLLNDLFPEILVYGG